MIPSPCLTSHFLLFPDAAPDVGTVPPEVDALLRVIDGNLEIGVSELDLDRLLPDRTDREFLENLTTRVPYDVDGEGEGMTWRRQGETQNGIGPSCAL